MKMIVCVDDRMGTFYHNRRQSRDRLLRQDLLRLVGDAALWMSVYSAKQFEESLSANVHVDDAMLEKAGAGDYCFAEGQALAGYAERVSEFVIYLWNRRYPYDRRLDIDLDNGWHLTEETEFAGSSHEKITRRIYRRG